MEKRSTARASRASVNPRFNRLERRLPAGQLRASMRRTVTAILVWMVAGASAVALWLSSNGLDEQRALRGELRAKIDHREDLTGQVARQGADLTHERELAAQAKEADFLAAEAQEVEQKAARAEQHNEIQKAIDVARKAIAAVQARTGAEEKPIDVPPRALSQKRPQYPFGMHLAGVSGIVIVDFIVASDGSVRNAYAKSATRPEFEEAAVSAVNQWTFEAGLRKGRRVNVHMQVPIVFSLLGDNGAAPASDWLPMDLHEG